MSARSLGVLSVDLVAKIGGFTKGMTQAEREAQKSSKAIERRLMQMGAGVEKAMKVAGAAALASFAVIGAGVKNAIDAADALGKMSQRTGVSVEALSRLEVAASQSDTSLETLQKGLINLGRAQLEARRGTEEQVALFKALGLRREAEIIPYCQGGIRAAHSVLALTLAGFDRVRNYEGSWAEWSRTKMPATIEPDRKIPGQT